jgi:hypothetical protein
MTASCLHVDNAPPTEDNGRHWFEHVCPSLSRLWSNVGLPRFAIPSEFSTFVGGLNNKGVLLGEYTDAAGLVVSFLATP